MSHQDNIDSELKAEAIRALKEQHTKNFEAKDRLIRFTFETNLTKEQRNQLREIIEML